MTAKRSSLKSVAIVSMGAAGQLVLQFALQLVLAHAFGADIAMDAYFSALALPTIVSTVVVSSLGYAFIPVFVEQRESLGEAGAWRVAGSFGLLLVITATTLAASASLLAEPLVGLLHPGFSPVRQQQTSELFRILAWLILTNSLIGFLQAIYHASSRFALPALAPLLGVAVTLGYTIAFHRMYGITAVAVGIVLGAVVTVVLQLPPILRHLPWRIVLDHPMRRCLWLLLPLIAGAAYANLDPLVDRYLASQMPVGNIARLGYAWRLTSALLLVSTSGLSIVAFPALASHWAARREDAFRGELAHAMRFLCFLIVPMVVGLLLFSRPVVEDLFQRGQFSAQDTAAVARLLSLYAGVVIAASFGGLAAKVFYAWGDTRSPALIGALGFTIGAVIKFLLAPRLGVDALVAATSAYYALNGMLLVGWIAVRCGRSAFEGVGMTLFKSCAGSAAAAAAGALVLQSGLPLDAILAAAVGGVVYWLVLLLLRDEFARQLARCVLPRGAASSAPRQHPTAEHH